MEEFSAPSFSLGLDLDDDPPPPSFSLGLDLDDDPPAPSSLGADDDPPAPSFSLGTDLDISDLPTEGEEDDRQPEPEAPLSESPPDDLQDPDEELIPIPQDSDIAPPDDDTPPTLKRLRRGPGPNPSPRPPSAARPPPSAIRGDGWHESPEFLKVDDDIEEFSSQEERWIRDECSTLPNRATCSSSKLSLHGRGVLTSQPAKKLKDPKISPAFNASTSPNLNATSKKMFPKLTISPLRKFCLVDSDSDDPSSSKDTCRENKDADASLKTRYFTSQSVMRNEKKPALQQNEVQTENLWKDFSPKINTNLATPILDEFCKEYFRSEKEAKTGKRKVQDVHFNSSRVIDLDSFEGDHLQRSFTEKAEHGQNLSNPQAPAYQYFYHDDARIRALVRDRLLYFFPLGAENIRGSQQSAAENLDYMSQFSGNKNSQGSSKNRGRRPSSAKGKEASTGGWVNPKSSANLPKNAGKRRVRADGVNNSETQQGLTQSSGRWFTGGNGRKVYVTKNGEELTGRTAYMQYKKDTGKSRKSKKPAAGKKQKR